MRKIRFMLLAMLIGIAVVFAGCNEPLDAQVKVNIGNKDNYVNCTSEENFMLAMENLEPPENSEEQNQPITVKLTLKINLTLTEGLLNPESETPNNKVEANALINAMFSFDEKLGLATKVSVNLGEDKKVYEIYIKDGYVYLNDEKQKVKVEMSEIMGEDSLIPDFDLEEVVEPFKNVIQDYTKQKVLKNEEKSIYQLEVGENQNIYVVLNNNQIKQLYVDFEEFDLSKIVGGFMPQLEVALSGIKADLNLAMEINSSNITYPSLNEYKEPSEEEVA